MSQTQQLKDKRNGSFQAPRILHQTEREKTEKGSKTCNTHVKREKWNNEDGTHL